MIKVLKTWLVTLEDSYTEHEKPSKLNDVIWHLQATIQQGKFGQGGVVVDINCLLCCFTRNLQYNDQGAYI